MTPQSRHQGSLRNIFTPFIMIAFLLLMLCGLSGCGTVQPWERGTLSDYTMRADRDPGTESFREHVYFTREAAAGGRGVGGGGCGCN
ncbi:MAG: DUF4266 domain-containing protein [bacterium]